MVSGHVQDLEDKFRDHTERFLKYNTVAKLYFNLGEVDLALKYLDKFLKVRGTSAHAFFRGQILEKSLEKSSDPEALHSKRRAALDAFKTTFDLDQSKGGFAENLRFVLPLTSTGKYRHYGRK